MNILVTGTSGFIGFHLANRLIADGHNVTGIDVINDYYDVNLKYGRLANAGINKAEIVYGKAVKSTVYPNYTFYQINLENKNELNQIFETEGFDVVINLAAQAGVRYSIEKPDAYISSNIMAFISLLECCKHHTIKHLVYASSSSVYGLNEAIPFSTSHNTDHPISIYAATKKSNELMAHVYSQLFNLPTTGLRFFTVYGPWGRPDMALFIFTRSILEGKPIQLFNYGNAMRDFTYVNDIVEGVVRVMNHTPQPNHKWNSDGTDLSSSSAPYKIYNIGNNAPVSLLDLVNAIEKELGIQAIKKLLPLQPGDVTSTFADVSDLVRDTGYKPATSFHEGVKNFINWYKMYYKVG